MTPGGRCLKCANAARAGTGTTKSITATGYVSVARNTVKFPGRGKASFILEHRAIFAEFLGRDLLEGETVHHKNGVRHDNRLRNLELWVSNQPSGQRIEDLLEWADEIISLYRHVRRVQLNLFPD